MTIYGRQWSGFERGKGIADFAAENAKMVQQEKYKPPGGANQKHHPEVFLIAYHKVRSMAPTKGIHSPKVDYMESLIVTDAAT